MKIFQFISEECQDLVEAAKVKRQLVDLGEFPHDDIIMDSDNKPVPVVYVDNVQVPVSDFFTMERDDFVNAWKLPSSAEAYDNYIGALHVLEGPEVIDRVRRAILAETETLEHDVDMFMTF